MRDYAADTTLRYRNVTTADFQRICEDQYASSLKWFFNEWAFADTPIIDRPAYDCTWKVQPSGTAYSISLVVKQTTATSLAYRMPFQISIATAATSHIMDVVDSSVTQMFVFHTDAKPREYIIDPLNWVFKNMTVHDPSKR
jgi:aminopeptidase N